MNNQKLKDNNKTAGIIFSYLVIISSTIANFILIPVYLKTIGADRYGLYQYVYSIAQYATILDFGISSILIKYLSVAISNNDSNSIENTQAHIFLLVIISNLVIIFFGILAYINLDTIVINRTSEEIAIARRIFPFMIGQIILGFLQNYYDGVLLAFEKYSIDKFISFIRVVFRFCFILLLIILKFDIYSIVLGYFISSLLCLLWSHFEIIIKRIPRLKFHYFSKKLFNECLLLALAIMIQSIAAYVNNTLDKYVVGVYLTNIAVTYYSLSLQISDVFINLSTTANTVFMPKVANLISNDCSNDVLTDYVIKIGRYQCIICMGILIGFLVIGKKFISLWTGINSNEVWIISIMLMISNTLPMVESTCNSILIIKNRQYVRSINVIFVALTNLIFSIILVQQIGVIGVSVGTLLAKAVGSGILMNIYYKYFIGLDVKKMLLSIFSKIPICAVVAGLMSILTIKLISNIYISVFSSIIVFCCVYFLLLLLFGFNSDELSFVKSLIRKVQR